MEKFSVNYVNLGSALNAYGNQVFFSPLKWMSIFGFTKERPSSPLLKLELSPTILVVTDFNFVGKLSTEHFHVEGVQIFVYVVVFADFAPKSSHDFMCFISKEN